MHSTETYSDIKVGVVGTRETSARYRNKRGHVNARFVNRWRRNSMAPFLGFDCHSRVLL